MNGQLQLWCFSINFKHKWTGLITVYMPKPLFQQFQRCTAIVSCQNLRSKCGFAPLLFFDNYLTLTNYYKMIDRQPSTCRVLKITSWDVLTPQTPHNNGSYFIRKNSQDVQVFVMSYHTFTSAPMTNLRHPIHIVMLIGGFLSPSWSANTPCSSSISTSLLTAVFF